MHSCIHVDNSHSSSQISLKNPYSKSKICCNKQLFVFIRNSTSAQLQEEFPTVKHKDGFVSHLTCTHKGIHDSICYCT